MPASIRRWPPHVPDRPCLIHGEAVLTWREVDRRAESLAADLVGHGIAVGSKVACYLYNSPEYLETVIAAFKARLVPVNTNYRYRADELVYLLDDSDAEVVVFNASFTETLSPIRSRLPKVRRWYVVPDSTGTGPGWDHPLPGARVGVYQYRWREGLP
jgi:3-oxocholest-4-en-26-oate---CoA ligase